MFAYCDSIPGSPANAIAGISEAYEKHAFKGGTASSLYGRD